MNDKPKKRNYTRELIREKVCFGAVIECAVAPYEGWDVYYTPRSVNDPQPWVLTEDGRMDDYRYSGRECRVRKEGTTS